MADYFRKFKAAFQKVLFGQTDLPSHINKHRNCENEATAIIKDSKGKVVHVGDFYKYDILESNSAKYEVLDYLGEGFFGDVLLGWNKTGCHSVAIKVLKKRSRVIQNAAREINILKEIKKGNGECFHLIDFQDFLEYKSQYCLIFESLQETLRSFIKKQKNLALPLPHIRVIMKQVFIALNKLQELHIIHTDIKPENIMIIDSEMAPYQIKIIDLGNSIHFKETERYGNLQTLAYRSPEMILGTRFNSAIDTWSLGCIAAEMYMGTLLYSGNTPYDQIRLITRTQGVLEPEMISDGRHSMKYFNNFGSSWMLKSPHIYQSATGEKTGDSCKHQLSSLDDLRSCSAIEKECKLTTKLLDRRCFVNLVKLTLTLNYKQRIVPREALNHSFLTLKHLDNNPTCEYVKNCREVLDLVQL